MTTFRTPGFRTGLAAAVAALLAACGGGGGGGGGQPVDNVAVTAQNQDDVARASFAGAASTAVGGFTGVASGGAASPLAVKRAQSAAQALRKRIAADVSADLCPGGGAADLTETDTVPLGQANVGDGASIVFTNCNDGAGSVANGRMSLTITAIGTSSLSFGVATTAFTVTELATGYRASLDGSFGLTLSSSPGSFVTQLSVPNQLVMDADVGTVTDVITLLDGYSTTATYTPANATTTATAGGAVASDAAGGFFRISTPMALVQTDNEDYPHAGQILAIGVTGKLRATVLSNTQVRIEVDANDDGTYEASKVVPWSDLL